MKYKLIKLLLSIFFIISIVYGIYNIWLSTKTEEKGITTYKEIEKNINKNTKENQTDAISWPDVDFKSLNEITENVIGWIYIKQLDISYPIVQGKNNDYYLNHLITGDYNPIGSIFLDYRNKSNLSDKHSIIYGHHTNSNTMFTRLEEYSNQNMLDEYPYYLIITPKKKYKVDIFAGYVALTNEDSWKLDFNTSKEVFTWINETRSKSLIKANFIPTPQDKIITLSTCYHHSTTRKFLLVGVLREYE